MTTTSALQLKATNGLNPLYSWKKFLSPARTSKKKVECWIKVYTMIFNFYMNPKNENKEFSVSNQRILKVLNEKWGNDYHISTIQNAIKTIEDLKLATVSFEKKFKENSKASYIKRIVKLDMEKALEIFSCMNFEQSILKDLYKSESLKKIYNKRPFVLEEA